MTPSALRALRVVARFVVAASATGSMISMVRVGRNAPLFLLVVFAGWILAPFAAMLLADRKGTQWSLVTRVTLYILTIVLSLGSVALYADVVLRPPASTPAARFVVVPVASLLVLAIVIPLARFMSRR